MSRGFSVSDPVEVEAAGNCQLQGLTLGLQAGLASMAPILGYTPVQIWDSLKVMAEAESEAKRQGIGIWKKANVPNQVLYVAAAPKVKVNVTTGEGQ